jgi:hypothetical protein
MLTFLLFCIFIIKKTAKSLFVIIYIYIFFVHFRATAARRAHNPEEVVQFHYMQNNKH